MCFIFLSVNLFLYIILDYKKLKFKNLIDDTEDIRKKM